MILGKPPSGFLSIFPPTRSTEESNDHIHSALPLCSPNCSAGLPCRTASIWTSAGLRGGVVSKGGNHTCPKGTMKRKRESKEKHQFRFPGMDVFASLQLQVVVKRHGPDWLNGSVHFFWGGGCIDRKPNETPLFQKGGVPVFRHIQTFAVFVGPFLVFLPLHR